MMEQTGSEGTEGEMREWEEDEESGMGRRKIIEMEGNRQLLRMRSARRSEKGGGRQVGMRGR